MIKIALLLLALASPANAGLNHGAVSQADGFCNLVTGVYTGVGGTSTCNSVHATCNGSTDDTPAFTSFNTWATGTWQVAHPGLKLALDLPGICTFVSSGGGTSFAGGIKRLLVEGVTGNRATAGLKDGGAGFTLGGQGMHESNQFDSRIATIAKGSTSVALTACPGAGCAAAVAIYTVGDKGIITGIDTQGPGSSPPNPAFWDYVTINCVSTTLTCGGGNIGFNEPLTNDYKSTWPSYSSGSSSTYDQGGPGTIYDLIQTWNTDVEYQNLTIDATAQQTQCISHSCTLTNVVVTGAFCVFPTEIGLLKFVNSSLTSCNIEVDKMIDAFEIDNSTVNNISVQSASVKKFTINASAANNINGLFLSNFYINSTVASLNGGVGGGGGFGAAGAMSVTNTAIANLSLVGNFPTSWHDVNLQYTMSGGVITIPPNGHITAASSGPGGEIRLTVDNSTGYTAGKEIQLGLAPASPCLGANGGVFIIDTIPNGTTIDLAGSTFTATCTGTFGTLPAAWAIPGANIFFVGLGGFVGPVFQVLDLTQDASGVHVQTSLAGGFPTVPLSLSLTGVAASAMGVAVHPGPKWTSSGATGDPEIVDLNNAGAQGLPIGSYSKRTITSANGNPASPVTIPVWGTMTGVNITVGTAYNGSTGTMNFDFNGPAKQTLGSAAEAIWNFEINAKVANATPRAFTPTGATGAQTGDILTPPGANTWFLFNQIQPVYSSIPGDFGSTSVVIEIMTSQGVVYP